MLQNRVLEKKLDIFPDSWAYWIDFMANDPDTGWFASFKFRT